MKNTLEKPFLSLIPRVPVILITSAEFLFPACPAISNRFFFFPIRSLSPVASLMWLNTGCYSRPFLLNEHLRFFYQTARLTMAGKRLPARLRARVE